MWYYLLPAISFYLALFFERAFSPVIAIPIFIILLIISLKYNKISLFVLYSILLFLLIAKTERASYFSTSLEETSVKAIYGYVDSPKSTRRNRDAGFRLNAVAVIDKYGSVFSAKGIIYVISDLTDVGKGDYVRLDGKIEDVGYFLAESTMIVKYAPFGRLRRIVLPKLYEAFSSESGALSSLLILGNDVNGNTELKDLAAKTGLSHLLSLSGMHLAIISSIVEKPLRRLFGKRFGTCLSFSVLFVFTYLSGWKPSLFRALLFRLLSRILESSHAFVFSEVCLFVLSPNSISDLGAAFSFISLSGILLLSGRIKKSIDYILPFPNRVTSSVAESTSAILFSIPLAFVYYGQYQLWAILSGVIASMMISLFMSLSLASIVFAPLRPVLDLLYFAIRKYLLFLSEIEVQTTIYPYLNFVVAVALFIASTSFLEVFMDKRHKYIPFLCRNALVQ